MRRIAVITAVSTVVASAPAWAQDQVRICHATGDPEAPYQGMALDDAAVLDHVGHEDDLVPAPEGGCPATEVVLLEDAPEPTATPQYAVPAPSPTPTATPRHRDREGGDVQGGGGGGGAPTLASSPPGSQPVEADTRGLPMTGAETWLVAGAGIGVLLCGSGLRILSSAAGRPPGPSGR